ncbi:MAG: hypothetical protein ABSE16_14955 [Verrucomicrobiota bacterium]|jgi:hypothetical protein
MKTSEKPCRTRFNKFSARLVAVVCAAAAVCLAWNSQAANILVNPGYDESPSFTGWSAHSTETWSYTPNSTLVLSPPNALWMQGLYENGNAPATYISYVYQTFSAAPGSSYTADAWFSQFVHAPPGEGGDDVSGGSGLFGNNDYPAYSTNTADAGYYEDGWVEVQFLDVSNNILADYKSVIIDPPYVHNLAASGATTTNVTATTTNVYLNWFDVPVTNIYNPSTIVVNGDPDPSAPATTSPGPTGSLAPGQNMTAPVATAHVQFMLVLCQHVYASGAPHWDNCTLNQVSGPQPSIIGNITPNGGQFFNIANTNFTFTVSSPTVGITTATNGIQVVENGVNKSSSLAFSGNSTDWNVTLPGLTSNTVYSMSITVSNSAGLVSTASANFDTFSPGNFIVEAEDYDYDGGHFIQDPIPTNATTPFSYFGRPGISNIDYAIYAGGALPGNGNNLIPNYPYRNTDPAWQIPSDPELPLYIAQSNSAIYNVNIAYNNGGNWFNYTRDPYPSGYYLVYARMSDGGTGGSEYLNMLTSGYGTATQTTTNLGVFLLPSSSFNTNWMANWSAYYWVPLTDINGNLIPVNIPAGLQTLQLVSGLGCNLIDFMFVPLPPLGLPPYIGNFNQPILVANANVFMNISSVSFTVSSLISSIPQNNVQTILNGVSVPETFTGNSSNWTVSFSVPANQLQNFTISAVDANGLSNSITGTFDTFSQTNFMIEAGDFDFNGGQWIDNPIETGPNVAATNSYFGYPGGNPANSAEFGVDYSTTNVTTAETYVYRYDGNTPGTVSVVPDAAGTEVTSDILRDKFINEGSGAQPPYEYVPSEAVPTTNTDYDVGWWPPATWLNYTRTFPTNTYLVYGRLAGGNGAYGVNQSIGPMTVSLVTAGRGMPSQTTQLLGTFSDPNANGWQSWHWIPLMNNGTNVAVSLGGVETLNVTAPTNGLSTGNVNGHFYMLVPYSAVGAVAPFQVRATVSGGVVSIKFSTVNGHSYTVQYSGSLSPANWQTLSSGIAGDGAVETVTDTTAAARRFYRVEAQ